LNLELINSIKALSEKKRLPDKTPYWGLSVEKILLISEKHAISLRLVEIAALHENIIPERYVRNMKSFSPSDQILLLEKTVCVVGLGGLGGGVTEILARMGMGKLILIDGDHFEDSNLNRQWLSRPDLLGVPKAFAAQKRVQNINPSVEAISHHEFLDENNADRLVQGADIIVDCLDNLKTRFTLEKAARKSGTLMVSGAVAGSTGQVTTLFPEDCGLESIYGDPGQLPEKGIETSLGTLSYTVTLVSALECAEVIKIFLNRGKPLKRKLLIINPLENLYEVIGL
jgi:molybdopterin-synthase adenylyltransferase